MDYPNSLHGKQLTAINERALRAFGSKIQAQMICFGFAECGSDPFRFKHINTGMVFAITFRYTAASIPINSSADDLLVSDGLGYERENIVVCVARVVSSTKLEIAVKLERALCMSYGNGPETAFDTYVLHKDGTVKYFDPDSGAAVGWKHHIPHWEQTRFPLIQPVVSGF